jgi:hypothetical protein
VKVTPYLIGDLSGSVGGVTAAKARSGIQYLRFRATPSNPQTARQQTVRAAMSALSSDWKFNLTPTERDSWSVQVVGQPESGIGAFNRGNVARLQSGMSPVLEFDGSLSHAIPSIGAATNAGSAISVVWQANGWEDIDGAALLFYVQQPVPPSRTFQNRYRFGTVVLGDSGSAPTSPASFASPWGNSFTAGDKSVIRVMFVDPSGRYAAAGTTELTWA